EDVQGVRVTAPAPPGRAAGRHHQDRAGRGRDDAADPFRTRLELLRRPEEEEERVVSQRGLNGFVGGLVAVAEGLQAHPPSPRAHRARLAREVPDKLKRAGQAARSLFLFSHVRPHPVPGLTRRTPPRVTKSWVGPPWGFLVKLAVYYAVLACSR